MNWGFVITQTLGGLGLFLIGMKIMSDGLQKTAGDNLRKIINILTSNSIIAIIIGVLITAIIQSSSATTVLTVGFVNAGLMNLKQAIGIIFGANIGTTITSWIVILPIVKYYNIFIIVGVIINFFISKEKWKYFGETIFGLGILFLGMQTMGNGVSSLKSSQLITDIFMKIDGTNLFSILLGVLSGCLITAIIQSSSVTMGLLIVLANNGLINFAGAISLIFGFNIGTTVTALLASIGTSRNAKRAAIAHTMFNLFGTIIILPFFYLYVKLIDFITPGDPNYIIKTSEEAIRYGSQIGMCPYMGSHLAMAHTLFNIINTLIFTGFIPYFVKLCELIIPITNKEKELDETFKFTYLTYSLVETPTLALVELEKELLIMANVVKQSANCLLNMIRNIKGEEYTCSYISFTEKKIDRYQFHITEFLLSLSGEALSKEDSILIGNYITMAHNLEKFADHIEKISLILEKIKEKKIKLPKEINKIIEEIYLKNIDFFERSIKIFENYRKYPKYLEEAQVISNTIKRKILDAKEDYFKILQDKSNKNYSSIYFIEILNSLDGLRTESYNIAEIVSGTKY